MVGPMVTIYDHERLSPPPDWDGEKSLRWSPGAPITIRPMTDTERLESFAVRSGLAPGSVDALRPDFPRMVKYMREHGVTEIPDSPLTGDAHATNMASLLIRQAARHKGDAIAHELRNLTGIRPWKI